MSYADLVPKEYSSGTSRWQGSITKVGNAHSHVIVEFAWSYRHSPRLGLSNLQHIFGIIFI
ncbi:transposase [Paenibacillus athensensis]|uniref:Transposase IS116/IS110/IS902 C-terminal domain-containing protein n=2 Tax=Paenibacillus athensensis TaxID=1967502 RepID=A0A4Y8Q276_9BACL|nr:transposase [Paenibacillus athensensis]